MEILLPDDGAIKLMNAEYQKVLARAASCALSRTAQGGLPSVEAQNFLNANLNGNLRFLLYLYFIASMVYNIGYGTEISYRARDMGGLQPGATAFKRINNIK